MSNRTFVSLIVILLAVVLIIKFDVFTKVKMCVTNLLYGKEMTSINALHVVVDPLMPDLEAAGLDSEEIRQQVESMLMKNKARVLTDEEWRKTPKKPSLNITIDATKTEGVLFRFNVTISVQKSEAYSFGAEKLKLIWVTSGVGEGGVVDIRAKIAQEMELFFKAHGNE